MATTSESKMKLKLLVDKKGEKVLFAEAGKDFVDFLFSLIYLPLGNVITLLSKKKMVGCLGNLYGSIESLSDTYIQSTLNKEFILKPKSHVLPIETPLLLPNTESVHVNQKIYVCPNCSYNRWHTLYPTTQCPNCRGIKMTCESSFVGPNAANQVTTKNGEGGFVKDLVTYMVMDNLEVKPMSTISSITLMNTFGIRDLGSLEEKVVDIGVDEGLKLLQASLEAKNVLTSIFLKAK